jgi:hypothetical protein
VSLAPALEELMRRIFAALVVVSVFTGCVKKKNDDGLTYAQAREALDEAQLATEAATLLDGTVEISTNFTIGQAVEAAAAELRSFVASQLPCAEVTLSAATLEVEYGKKPGNCRFKGQTYSGTHAITVARNDQGNVQVDHTWTNLTNGKVSVSGTAEVTWNFTARSRTVVHTLTWTRVSDGRTATGSGDRTQTVLEGGLLEGIKIDGTREWSGDAGSWDLAISGVEMRWVDPVPQSGSYVLRTPAGRSATLSFARKDASVITVSVESGDKQFSFDVRSL